MKKQAVLTAVASLLTFASVVVLPAFAQDTGGRTYNPMPRGEQSSYRWDHERHHGKGDWRGHGGYGYNRHDYGSYGKERPKGSGSYDSGRSGSGYGSGYGSGSYGSYGRDMARDSR